MFGSLNVAASGLTAERMRLDTIANDLANAQTTSTPGGGPFRSEMVVFSPLPSVPNRPGGVVVTGIVGSSKPFPLTYDPGSPDANAQGYVQMSNVNVTSSMVDMIAAQQAYSANATAFSDFVKEEQSALQI